MQHQQADREPARRLRARRRILRQAQALRTYDNRRDVAGRLVGIPEHQPGAVARSRDVAAVDGDAGALTTLAPDDAVHDAGDDAGGGAVAAEEILERVVAEIGGGVEGRAGDHAGVQDARFDYGPLFGRACVRHELDPANAALELPFRSTRADTTAWDGEGEVQGCGRVGDVGEVGT